MRDFRPQAPVLGVALEGFKDEAGFPQALALGIQLDRYVEIAWRDVEPQQGVYRWEALVPLEEEFGTPTPPGSRPSSTCR